MKKRMIQKLLCSVAVLGMMLGVTGCGVTGHSEDLMQDIKPQKEAVVDVPIRENRDKNGMQEVTNKETLSEADVISMTDFAVRLFQQSLEEEENTLLSPLSVISALGMTANGADGETLAQMEQTFGMSLASLNQYLSSYREDLPKKEGKYKLSMANAIWFKDVDSLTVEKAFLQTNADYYSAEVRKAPFDESTVKEINTWVSDHTDGMIPDILNRIPEDAQMCLVNALAFDAEWQETYYEHQVRDGAFTKEDGTTQDIKLMYSEENAYLEDDNAVGFMKYYADRKYAFAALLPEEGINVSEYVDSLTGEKLNGILTNVSDRPVNAALPKFQNEYSIEMSDVLKAMGMADAFDAGSADFSSMGHSENGNLYISQVIHKTFIGVDELGTKAGAATLVMMTEGCAFMEQEPIEIYLDRPFVYMIVDCEENVPVFIGVVREIEG